MSDQQVEKYIHIFFSNSPRANSGTAPTFEWLQFLEMFNEQQNHYILTEQQKKAIKPYCIQNPDLEMTPEEFIKLLAIIRHEATVEERRPRATLSTPAARRLFDSRPRSSRLISSKSATTYYDDRASTNHPDDSVCFDTSSDSSFNPHFIHFLFTAASYERPNKGIRCVQQGFQSKQILTIKLDFNDENNNNDHVRNDSMNPNYLYIHTINVGHVSGEKTEKRKECCCQTSSRI